MKLVQAWIDRTQANEETGKGRQCEAIEKERQNRATWGYMSVFFYSTVIYKKQGEAEVCRQTERNANMILIVGKCE